MAARRHDPGQRLDALRRRVPERPDPDRLRLRDLPHGHLIARETATVAALLGSSDPRDVATARLAALRAAVLLPGQGPGTGLAGILWHVQEEERRLALAPDPEWWEAARSVQGHDGAPYVPWEPPWLRR